MGAFSRKKERKREGGEEGTEDRRDQHVQICVDESFEALAHNHVYRDTRVPGTKGSGVKEFLETQKATRLLRWSGP